MQVLLLFLLGVELEQHGGQEQVDGLDYHQGVGEQDHHSVQHTLHPVGLFQGRVGTGLAVPLGGHQDQPQDVDGQGEQCQGRRDEQAFLIHHVLPDDSSEQSDDQEVLEDSTVETGEHGDNDPECQYL